MMTRRTAIGCLLGLVSLGWSTLAGAQTAWPKPEWQTATPESQGMSTAAVEKVGQWLKDNASKSGLIVRHGRIVGEWYFEGADKNTQLLVYSTSKSFASTAAGLAIAEGKLTLDSKVGQFVPQASPAEKLQVTVRQLISMTTGVHNNPTLPTRPDVFSYAVQEAPMDFRPGEKWDYNNTGLALLSPVLRKATGVELDQYLRDKLFRRIGIADDTWHWEQREQQTLSYSGLHITARSLARFGLLFLNQGRWQDEQLVATDWVKAATGPSQTLNPSYGYLWWNNTTDKWPGVPRDAYAALGRSDNSMLIVPSLDLVVLRQMGEDGGTPRKSNIGQLWKLACDAVVEQK